jgi:hypothetical protein
VPISLLCFTRPKPQRLAKYAERLTPIVAKWAPA